MIVYRGSVAGFKDALRASRRAVMALGDDKLSNQRVCAAIKREFSVAQTKDLCLRRSNSIA